MNQDKTDEGHRARLLKAEDVRMLAEIGFMSLSRNQPANARAIFDALQAVRPGSEVVVIAEGVFWLMMDEPEIAAEHLRNGPQTDAVQVFLGMALLQFDRDNAREVVASINPAETCIAELAKKITERTGAKPAKEILPLPVGAAKPPKDRFLY